MKSGRYQRVEGLTTLDVNRMQCSARRMAFIGLSFQSIH
jgi:hypothetical protein